MYQIHPELWWNCENLSSFMDSSSWTEGGSQFLSKWFFEIIWKKITLLSYHPAIIITTESLIQILTKQGMFWVQMCQIIACQATQQPFPWVYQALVKPQYRAYCHQIHYCPHCSASAVQFVTLQSHCNPYLKPYWHIYFEEPKVCSAESKDRLLSQYQEGDIVISVRNKMLLK